MKPEGFNVFDYSLPPERDRPLTFIFFDGSKFDGLLTWDEERRVYVFECDGIFFDADDVEFWKYSDK